MPDNAPTKPGSAPDADGRKLEAGIPCKDHPLSAGRCREEAARDAPWLPTALPENEHPGTGIQSSQVMRLARSPPSSLPSRSQPTSATRWVAAGHWPCGGH